MNVTPSGIASLLLPGGRTTYSIFKIHVPCLDSFVCNIDKKIWPCCIVADNKADNLGWGPMTNKFYFESLDKYLKDIMGNENVACQKIFGGKICHLWWWFQINSTYGS